MDLAFDPPADAVVGGGVVGPPLKCEGIVRVAQRTWMGALADKPSDRRAGFFSRLAKQLSLPSTGPSNVAGWRSRQVRWMRWVSRQADVYVIPRSRWSFIAAVPLMPVTIR